MKKFLCGVYICFCFFIVPVSGVAADLKDGFLDYIWGEDISQYPELGFLYEKGQIAYYINPGEYYTIKDEHVYDVIFGFYKGSLFGIYIGIIDFELYTTVDQYLISKYGMSISKVSEEGHKTVKKWKYNGVVIKLKAGQAGEKMKLAIYNSKLVDDLRKEQLDKAGETAHKLLPIDKNKKTDQVPLLEF